MKTQKFLGLLSFTLILLISLWVVPIGAVHADQSPLVDGQAGANALAPSAVNVITVTTTADNVINFDGVCSLREAIISANTNPVGFPVFGECRNGSDTDTDRIVLEAGAVYQLSLIGMDDTAQSGDLDILDNSAAVDIELVVAGGGTATIEGQTISESIIQVHGATVSITGLIFQHGGSTSYGGALRSNGNLTLTDSVVKDSQASYGGGIFNDGTMTIVNSSVINNVATVDGGGIYNTTDAVLTINQSQIQENSSEGDLGGGGIYNGVNSELTINTSQIDSNQTDSDGGGIYNDAGATLNIESGSMNGNNSVEQGGAIFNRGTVTIDGTEFEGNGGNLGGAIYNTDGGQVTIQQATFSAQNIADNGGALYNEAGSEITVEDSTMINNKALFSGGAIANLGEITLEKSNLQLNEAGLGGAFYNAGTMIIREQSNIFNNKALALHGGAFYQNAGSLTVLASSMFNNTADDSGGAGFINAGFAYIVNSTIGGNEANVNGGGLYGNDSANIYLTNVTVNDNDATAGAALYKTAAGSITLVNSIISAANGTTCLNSQGDLDSDGHNIFRDNSCPHVEQPGDLIGDPRLENLAQDGGTYIYPLQEDSPAVDAGDATICASLVVGNQDQTGKTRPVGSACDIGSVEAGEAGQAELPFKVFLPMVIR